MQFQTIKSKWGREGSNAGANALLPTYSITLSFADIPFPSTAPYPVWFLRVLIINSLQEEELPIMSILSILDIYTAPITMVSK